MFFLIIIVHTVTPKSGLWRVFFGTKKYLTATIKDKNNVWSRKILLKFDKYFCRRKIFLVHNVQKKDLPHSEDLISFWLKGARFFNLEKGKMKNIRFSFFNCYSVFFVPKSIFKNLVIFKNQFLLKKGWFHLNEFLTITSGDFEKSKNALNTDLWVYSHVLIIKTKYS